MAKHTPGPWRHDPYEGSHESAIIGDCYQIATVYFDTFEHTNSRLIAAAPDLLAACKKAIEFWHSDHPNDTYEAQSAKKFIEDAIAKAEGNPS